MQPRPNVLVGSMEFGPATEQPYLDSSWENMVLTVLHWPLQATAGPLDLFKKATLPHVQVHAFFKSERELQKQQMKLVFSKQNLSFLSK